MFRGGMMKNHKMLMAVLIAVFLIGSVFFASSTVDIAGTSPSSSVWQGLQSNGSAAIIPFYLSMKTYWNDWNLTGDPLTIGNWTVANYTSANCTLYGNWANSSNLALIQSFKLTNSSSNFQGVNISGIQDSSVSGHNFYWNCVNGTEGGNTSLSKLLIDSNSPKVRIVYPTLADNSTFKNNKSITVSLNTSDINLDYCNLLFDGVVNQTKVILNNVTSNFEVVDNLPEGKTVIEVICFDKKGTKGYNNSNVTMGVDTVNPVLVVLNPTTVNATWLSSSAVNVTVNASDVNKKACDLLVDNGNGSATFVLNQTDSTLTGGNTAFALTSFTASNVLTAGRWYATCNDTVNHKVNTSVYTVYVPGVIGPGVQMISPANGSTNFGRTRVLNWTVTGNPAFNRYELRIFNRSGSILDIQNISSNATVSYTARLASLETQIADGWVLWNVTTVDNGGNRNVSSNASYSFKIDGSSECSTLKAGWNYCGIRGLLQLTLQTLLLNSEAISLR